MANDFLGNMVGVQTLDCLLFENCGNKSWGEAAFEAGLDRVPVAKFLTFGKNMVQAAKAARAARQATKTDRLKEHLTDRDLGAARREAAGEVVARRADGTPFDHVREVREAQAGLINRIEQINNRLGHPGTSVAERAELQRELAEASRLLDRSEEFLPR